MKLLHCTNCGDIVRIYSRKRTCSCLSSYAQQEKFNSKVVLVSGPCKILAISDTRFHDSIKAANALPGAISARVAQMSSVPALVLPDDCSSIKRLDVI